MTGQCASRSIALRCLISVTTATRRRPSVGMMIEMHESTPHATIIAYDYVVRARPYQGPPPTRSSQSEVATTVVATIAVATTVAVTIIIIRRAACACC